MIIFPHQVRVEARTYEFMQYWIRALGAPRNESQKMRFTSLRASYDSILSTSQLPILPFQAI